MEIPSVSHKIETDITHTIADPQSVTPLIILALTSLDLTHHFLMRKTAKLESLSAHYH